MNQALQSIFHILSYLAPRQLPYILTIPKFVLGSVGVFFFIFIIFALTKTSWIRYLLLYDVQEFFTFRAFGIGKITSDWESISARLETGSEAEYKLAVIEADAMLDKALYRLGFLGDTLPARLEKITAIAIPNIDELKIVHQTRDNIVHDPNFILSLDQARRTLAVFEQTFKTLDLI